MKIVVQPNLEIGKCFVLGRVRGKKAFTIAEALVGVIIVAICAGVIVLALNSKDKPMSH